MNLRLDWCSHEAAKYAVEHWHYSRTMQAGKSAKVGVWEDAKFIGAVVFTTGSGGTTAWAGNVGLRPEQMAELARVALTRHSAPVTRIISIAIRLLKRQSSGIRLLVSYADPQQGHTGGIYQAGGWVYVGKTSPDYVMIDQRGKVFHSRSFSKSGWKVHKGKSTRIKSVGPMQRQDLPGKHKYLMALDPEIRSRLLPLAKPYPKRVRSENGDTSAVHAEEGGSTPTRTLQSTSATAAEALAP